MLRSLSVMAAIALLMFGCGWPPQPPPQGALTFEPERVTIYLKYPTTYTQVVKVRSTGVVPVTITSVQFEDRSVPDSPSLSVVDSADSCLHFGDPTITPHFKVLQPGEVCEIVLHLDFQRAGLGTVWVWSSDKVVGSVETGVAP